MSMTAGSVPRRPSVGAVPAIESQAESPPFRFYDNRQKYLAFVNTCNEKSMVAARAARELQELAPVPPALRIFDAGMGDATVLSRLMSSTHRHFPTVPLLAVAKEISLEDVRLGLEKMPDRFLEHPHSVLVLTNLSYAEAPGLASRDPLRPATWHTVALRGASAYEYVEQIEALGPLLTEAWQTRPNPTTGNPMVVRPTVLVIHREDQGFLLHGMLPRPGQSPGAYDFVLASQPWRARTSARFKAEKVLLPLARSLRPGGRLLTVQSYGHDPGVEIVQRLWPGENPFRVNRYALLEALGTALGADERGFALQAPSDDHAIFRYRMHTLPSEIGDRIGTSTLFAAWNAAIYVNQIEDERLDPVVTTGSYVDATQEVLQAHGGLWFNDEAFIVSRHV